MTDTPPPGDESPLGAGLDLSSPDSPLAPYFLRPGQLAAAALLAFVAFLYSLSPLWHSDVWGHLKYAETFVQTRSLPPTEPFCEFADKETTIVHFAWLGQLTTLAAYRTGEALAGGDHERRLAGGVAGVRTLSLLLAVGVSVFLLLAYRRAGRSFGLAAAGLLAYNLLAPTGLGVFRPQLFGVLLFALLLWMLAGPAWTWRGALIAVVSLLFWGNLHGSFVMGLALIGVFAAGRALSLARTGGRWTLFRWVGDPGVRWMLAAFAGGAVGVLLLNPYGVTLPFHILSFSRHPVTATFTEFQPLSTTLGAGALHLYLAGLVVLVASYAAARRVPTPTEALIVVVFGLPPIGQRRLLVWWIPLVPFLAAAAWADLARRNAAEGDGGPHLRWTFAAGVIAAVALMWTPPVRWLVTGAPTPLSQALTAATPWQTTRQLRQEPGDEPALPELAKALAKYPGGRFVGRVFANEALGDWFLWDAPDRPIIVYSHSHVFNMSHWQACITVKLADPGWEGILDRWGVNLIAVEAATHEDLCVAVRKDARWTVIEDVILGQTPQGPNGWRFVALRKKPIGGGP